MPDDQYVIKKKILLIDDDIDDHELFQEAVSETFPDVKLFSAKAGSAAIDLLNSGLYKTLDLILLDVYMPGMSGWETLQLLKHGATTGAIPVIMISTSRTSGHVEQALQGGAVAYVTKPAKYSHILQLIRAILELPASELGNISKIYKPR